ncbi:hypothetical protein LSCM4_04031 [Leishmania orientalis]|uniref:Uncharacterized protein n=1 Tax=Leishmania orientalis TaxID=2249476 RepID=A0A836HDQ0_9TRYP|nr:hypothetical protein LSCM4_04031 [Leishmania orientalis]
MSWPRSRSGSYPPRRSQRDVSPPPALLLCSSPPSQSTPLRVFGTEITNHVPLSLPPPTSSSITAAPLDGATVDAAGTRTLLGLTPSCSWLAGDPYRCDSSRSGCVEHIPSLEFLLGAFSGVHKREGPPPQAGVRLPSSGSSDVSFGILLPLQTARGGGESHFEPTVGGASAQTGASMPPAPNAKRRPRNGDSEDEGGPTGPCSGRQAKRQRSERAVAGGVAGAFSATAPLPGRSASPAEEVGVGGRSGAGRICGGDEADERHARSALRTFFSEDGGDAHDFLTPMSTRLLCLPPVAPAPRPPSQHIHARACRPASLLDREHATPTWQVLTSAPTLPEEEGGEFARLGSTSGSTAMFSPARGNVLLRSAVDSTVIHSPLTLDDISPILCLSGEWLERCRMSAMARDRHSSAEVDDEERRADDTFVSTALSTPPRSFRVLTPAESSGDEEDVRSAAPDLHPQRSADSAGFVHTEVLRLLTSACEDVDDNLPLWPG